MGGRTCMIDGKNELLLATQQYSNWCLGGSCKCHIIAVSVTDGLSALVGR